MELIESSYMSSGIKVREAQNIAVTCLLEQDCRVMVEMEVSKMVGEWFLCINKVSFIPLLLPFFSHIY